MTSALFSTSESAALEREVDRDDVEINFAEIWGEKQRNLCVNWIRNNFYQKICLQFPDGYLPHSVKICDDLKHSCEAKFFILADTSYGSCCVDEIAAAHVEADALIHFGYACKSKVSRLPVFYVFPQLIFNSEDFLAKLREISSLIKGQQLHIYLDIPYQYLLEEDYKDVSDQIKNEFSCSELYVQPFPGKDNNKFKCEPKNICVFVGTDGQTFFNLSMSTKAQNWFIYNPSDNSWKEIKPLTSKWISRRYFYIEKCKDAQSLGLIAATLTADGYLDVVKRIQGMARARGIRTYLISVGRINPAKLANFMEIDCFVLIGCPFNNLYISRDFYKPIVSVFEAELALNPAWNMQIPELYATDFKAILEKGQFYNEFRKEEIETSDVSLVTGKIRSAKGLVTEGTDVGDGLLVERKNLEIMEGNGIGNDNRTWRGLEPNLGLNEPVRLEKGLSGIPTNYKHD